MKKLTRRDFVRDASAVGAASLAAGSSLRAWGKPTIQDATASTATTANNGISQDLHVLAPVPLEQVVVDDEFWSPKRKVWQQITVRDCFAKFERDRGGAINNFDKVRAGRDRRTCWRSMDGWPDLRDDPRTRRFLRNHPDPNWKSRSTDTLPALPPLPRKIRMDTSTPTRN